MRAKARPKIRGGAALAAAAIVISGCGDSGPKLEPEQVEAALADSGGLLPGARDEDGLDVSCLLPSGGDGIEDRWNCTIDVKKPVSDEFEEEARRSFPDDRGLHVEVALWVAAPDLSDDFPDGSYAAVQVDGDGLFEGGGAYVNGGCCIKDADLGTPEEYLDD